MEDDFLLLVVGRRAVELVGVDEGGGVAVVVDLIAEGILLLAADGLLEGEDRPDGEVALNVDLLRQVEVLFNETNGIGTLALSLRPSNSKPLTISTPPRIQLRVF